MIRQIILSKEIYTILDNIGLPNSGINLAFGDNGTTSSADGEILVALNPLNHKPTADYVRTLRYRLRQQFPDMEFYFQAADIVGQILNFGLPAPIDIQMTGRDPTNYALAKEIEARYQCRLKSSDHADRYLSAIDDAMKVRADGKKKKTS